MELSHLAFESRYVAHQHGALGIGDDQVHSGLLHSFLDDLLNTPESLNAIAQLSGVSKLDRFEGCLSIRMRESRTEEWHTHSKSTIRHRLGLVLNLSPRPYQGGDLCIRNENEALTVQTHTLANPGDGLLFRVENNYEYCDMPILGPEPKIAFVGWFSGD